MLEKDNEIVSDLNNRILTLLYKLPQYNLSDFNFKIYSGEPPDLKNLYDGE